MLGISAWIMLTKGTQGPLLLQRGEKTNWGRVVNSDDNFGGLGSNHTWSFYFLFLDHLVITIYTINTTDPGTTLI